MRILHAGWGFRPWRGGGLIDFAEDMMESQAARGHGVTYFFGGRHYPLLRAPRLHRWRRRGVQMLEVLGSTIPAGLDRGTRFPLLDLDEPRMEGLFRRALIDVEPQLVVLHELLGLPSSVIDVAHEHGVPVALIAQDYFPLCPTLKLFDADHSICLRHDPAPQCVRCCRDAPIGTRHMRQMTTAFELQRLGSRFPRARDRGRRALASIVRLPSGLPVDDRPHTGGQPPAPVEDYRRRRAENVERLARLDVLVGASRRLTEIYAQLGVPRDRLRTIRCTAGHIHRLEPRRMTAPPRPVRFATLAGAANLEKGSRVLLEAARLLEDSPARGGYRLDVHGLVDEEIRPELARLPSVTIRGRYDLGSLDSILDGVDVGIVPSIWEETLAHTGFEFLAKGVPVIVNAVGGMPEYTLPGTSGWLNRSCGGAELAQIMAGIVARPEEVVSLHEQIVERRDEFVNPLEAQIAELEEVFAELIARGGSDGGSETTAGGPPAPGAGDRAGAGAGASGRAR
ncbi:MAG TPA: glycosyltransferase [Thermoleophilaceae bacterium]|jgi:glycosyltransferase involved in cell wall biosynthesis